METSNGKRKSISCRISKYQAVYLTRKGILTDQGAIFARDFEQIGKWTRMTQDNCNAILEDKACQDFVLIKIKLDTNGKHQETCQSALQLETH